MKTIKSRKDLVAEMIRKLVIEHKRDCKKNRCGISSYDIYEYVYKPLMGDLAIENMEDFL